MVMKQSWYVILTIICLAWAPEAHELLGHGFGHATRVQRDGQIGSIAIGQLCTGRLDNPTVISYHFDTRCTSNGRVKGRGQSSDDYDNRYLNRI